jgi:hypothetical protein
MNVSSLKGLLPHVIAIVIFAVVAIVYCQPALQGKVLSQSDIQQWQGMAQESYEFREKHGHFPLWSNSMFGGMPGYSFAFEPPSKMTISYLHTIFTLGLPKPISFFFLASLMMYFLLMVLRIHPWIGIMGGLAYAYATYDPVIVAVGHDTKMICIAYAAGVIGSLLLIFRRHYLIGTILLAVTAGLIVAYSHLQIVYYTLLIGLALAIAFAVMQIKKSDWKHLLVSGALALLAAVLALAVNAVSLWPLNEYTKETMRGGRSELTPLEGENKTEGGLTKDYAFEYSYGIAETFTIIVPNIFGGGSGGIQFKPGKSKFANRLTELGYPEENAFQISNSLAYWGAQPILAGPVYLGAVICFLFILSLFFTRGWIKWGILAVSAFAIILAWGKNFEGVNFFLFDYMPLYNKFRAPTVALVIPQLGFVVLGCMAMHNILFGNFDRDEVWKKFKVACYVTGGVFALLIIMYMTLDYTGSNDSAFRQNITQQLMQGQQPTPQLQQQAEELTRSLIADLQEDRQGLFGKDLFRSLIFILIAAGSFWLYLKNKMKLQWALVIVALAASIDLLAVGKRYLNNDNFVEENDFSAAFIPTPADNQIKSDPDQNFRVFDQTAGNPFADSRASYHHNSIGGYNAARLALYNDLINRQFNKGNMNAFNMMNTRYFIMANPTTRQPEARVNPDANGAAWFVRSFQIAKNADEEMRALDSLNTKESAVIDQRYKQIAGAQPDFDAAATIQLVENLNDKLTYKTNAASNQFAVFSEIYYPYGWNAYVDGKLTEHARVNYVLRGMPVPAGSHTIEFRFEPRSVIVGDKITLWSCILVFILLLAGIVLEVRKKLRRQDKPVAHHEPVLF